HWYDSYMIAHDVEVDKIEDVQVWADYMTNEYIADYRARYNVTSQQVPFVPYDVNAYGAPHIEMSMNRPMIKQRGPYGRFPKFMLPSTVEDGVAPDGSIVIPNEHQPVRVFQPITWPRGRECEGAKYSAYGGRGFCATGTNGW